MLKLLNPTVLEFPLCTETVSQELLSNSNCMFYDKDGFELTTLEKEYYSTNGYNNCLKNFLNHTCFQEQWFELTTNDNFILDHSLILHRCSFKGDAKEQLKDSLKKLPRLSYLLQCPTKWGLDFSLDYVNNNGELVEVLHIEYDTKSYNEFLNYKLYFESFVLTTDWNYFANFLFNKKEEWIYLVGFEQNNWKARQLGFKQAEITHKSI